MRFGIFYEHQMAKPWERDTEHTLFKNALEQIELADKLGIQYVWEVEHHFLEEYSHSSAPEVFLAAASQRTKSIRLGHGVCLMPPGYNHPARVAERIATLDIVSDGRVEWGTGESSSEAELAGFGVTRADKRRMWAEGTHVAARLLAETPFAGWEGDYVQMPQRNLVPKPLQKPHPPIWVACSRRETIHMAASRGIGAMSFSFIEPEEARPWVADYYRIIEEECDPIGFSTNPNLLITLPFMCAPSEEEAIDRGLDGGHFFGYSLGHHYVFGAHQPAKTDIWAEFLERRENLGFSRTVAARQGEQLGAQLFEQGLGSLRGAIGTPDQIRNLLRRYEDAGVDQAVFVSQAGRNRHEDICESMELFAAKVLPEFVERDEAGAAARAARAARIAEKAAARLPRVRPADPAYTIHAAGQA